MNIDIGMAEGYRVSDQLPLVKKRSIALELNRWVDFLEDVWLFSFVELLRISRELLPVVDELLRAVLVEPVDVLDVEIGFVIDPTSSTDDAQLPL